MPIYPVSKTKRAPYIPSNLVMFNHLFSSGHCDPSISCVKYNLVDAVRANDYENRIMLIILYHTFVGTPKENVQQAGSKSEIKS